MESGDDSGIGWYLICGEATMKSELYSNKIKFPGITQFGSDLLKTLGARLLQRSLRCTEIY